MPILKSELYYPDTVSCSEYDISLHSTENKSTDKELSYKIYRNQINKMSIADNIVANNDYIKEVLTTTINHFEPTSYEILNQIIISLFMAISGIFITQPSIPAIFTPMAEHISLIK